MTPEDIKKLQNLQSEIEEIEKAEKLLLEKEVHVYFPKWDRYYTLPIQKIPGLKEEVLDLLQEAFHSKLLEVKERRDTLTLCREQKDQSVFKPESI